MDLAQVLWKTRRLTTLFRTALVGKAVYRNPIFFNLAIKLLTLQKTSQIVALQGKL